MKKTLFNDNFQCKVLAYDEAFLDISCGMDNADYSNVDIPHDALIGNAYEFYTDKVIWYRKKLNIIPSKNVKNILYFEGVYFDASIYINETLVGRWVNGYTSFYFDITDYITSPDDYLYVSINYQCPNSRWYGGPGINRNVWLYEANENHFTIDSLYINPFQNSDKSWTINASVETDSELSSVNHSIILEDSVLGIHEILSPDEDGRYSTTFTVNNPLLWDVDSPNVYTAKAVLSINDTITDTIDTVYGFRTVEMTPDRGLFLNGRHIKLNGVCLHSDQGCLGTAFYKEMARHQLTLMKEMGVNSIRLTHNVQAPGFLELCDEMGLLVLNEAFDCWKLPKTQYDYARFFEEWSAKDIRSWVMRDRNHPCVFLWSAGNEIYDTHAGEDGANTLRYITEEIRKNDFYNHAPVSLCSNYMAWENTQKAVDPMNFAGYNYGEFLYEEHHKAHPDWVIFGSETASVVQSRGVYHFPLNKSLLVDDDEHCSSLGNCATSWGAENMDFCITTERDTPYSLGQFLWAGIDYLGEPTPYHTKNSYFGIVDTACFPKDVYYLLQSAWRTFEDKPMIHLLPYWDFNEGQLIDIRICSNAPEVELFFNDVSLGRKRIDHKKDMILYADYQLPYQNGILRAVGYDASGNIAVETTEKSFGNTASLALSEDSFDVKAGDTTLRLIEIEAIDADGNPVKNACDRVNITIEGPAKLIGIGNGNQTDMESFTGNTMRLFSGKLLAVVKPNGQPGNVKIDAVLDNTNIYVRKLDISVDSPLLLTPEHDTVKATISVCPANADYKSIEYQITNESGVPIQNAQIENISDDGLTVNVHAIADADFCLRAVCREHDDRITVISRLEFKAEGFGELYKNPYSFISGSLYDDFKGELGNGNEKGVATSRTENSYLLYQNINFGETGTNTLEIPIFELGGELINLTFWVGMPHEKDSYVVGTGIYKKPSIWNVYQPETYRLDTVLTGIHDFGIEVSQQKIHIKGFEFMPLNTTYDMHKVREAREIYGDQYTITDELVKGIGNNVCITYKDMDFGAPASLKLNITGHTPLAQNTIHVRFNDGANESRQIIEFPYSDNLIEQCFELEPFTGKGDLSFIFLPGSNFDFMDFRFEQ